MDWSFASRAGVVPAVMSFRSVVREEQGLPQFPSFHASGLLSLDAAGSYLLLLVYA